MWSIKELLLFCCSDSLREITSLWWVIDELTSNTIRPQVCGQPCWYPLVCCFLVWTVMSSQHFGSDSSGNVLTWQRPRAQSSIKCGVGLHRALIWTITTIISDHIYTSHHTGSLMLKFSLIDQRRLLWFVGLQQRGSSKQSVTKY